MSIPTTANSLGPVHKVSKASTFSLKDNILKACNDKIGRDAVIFAREKLNYLTEQMESSEPDLIKITDLVCDINIILDVIKTRYGISDETIDNIKNNKLVDLAKVVF